MQTLEQFAKSAKAEDYARLLHEMTRTIVVLAGGHGVELCDPEPLRFAVGLGLVEVPKDFPPKPRVTVFGVTVLANLTEQLKLVVQQKVRELQCNKPSQS